MSESEPNDAGKSPRIEALEELRAFFAACDRRGGEGQEPEWDENRSVIEGSIRSGTADT
jgi:hypothetical protein